MKVFLFTMGSRGDFEPFFALAHHLQSQGHDVLLGTTREFHKQTSESGIPCLELPGNLKDLVSELGASPSQARRQFRDRIKPTMLAAFARVNEAILAQAPDIVIYHPKVLSAPLAAKKVGAVSVVAELAPFISPTGEFSAAGIGNGTAGIFNRLTFRLVAMSSALFARELRSMQTRLGIAHTRHDFSLCLVSPCIMARPKDWPATTILVGPWHSPKKSTRDNLLLLDFLSRGPTAYFGFGSMSYGDSEARTRMAIRAARENGLQALIVTGWGGLSELEPQAGVFFAESVNHNDVFPQVEVAVHHGGAGTVHASLRSGTPSVIVPFIADQPWWGNTLYRRGLAPRPISVKRLSVGRLSKAIKLAQSKTNHVKKVAECMEKEDPLGETLSVLEKILVGR